MNNKTTALIAVAVVIIAGWLVYRNNAADMPGMEGMEGATYPVGQVPEGVQPDDTVVPSASDNSEVKEFTVNGNNFSFSPKTMTVNKGDTVKINFVNAGGMHDLVIDEFNARTPVIQGGQTASVTFVADKSGAFEYYCSVGSHRQMGMVGTLTVK